MNVRMRKWPDWHCAILVAAAWLMAESELTRSSTPLPSSSSSLPSEVNDVSGPDTSSSESKSLLEKLRAPKRSELARKRSVAHNLPHDGRRVKAPKHSHDPKSVQPEHRVKEFPNECLTVSAKKLFCTACREEIALKRSIISSHVGSSKHIQGKERVKHKEARERDLASQLVVYDAAAHSRGETLSDTHRVYRVKVAMTFLHAGVPLNKLECFRPLLEENAYSIGGRRTISDLIPFILQNEQKQLKEEIEGRDVSVVFDGTTRLGEAMAVVIRFVDSDWKIQQRLVRLMLLAKSLSGEELARELIVVLSTTLGKGTQNLLAAMRDGAAVNGTAMRTVKVLYPYVLDVKCFSHTIDNAGRHFNTPILDEFMRSWLSLFSHSPKARLQWKDRTGRSMRTFSDTRWWSKWEVMDQLLVMYGDVKGFLDDNPDIGQATRTKLLAILNDPVKASVLQIELAAVIDGGNPLVKATYNLEGDGALVLKCYEQICTVINSIRTAHHPNVRAVAERISSGDRNAFQQWTDYAKACVQGAQRYFLHKIEGDLGGLVEAFKVARLFCPQKVTEMQVTANSVDSLKVFPFLDKQEVIDGLKEVLPQYLAKAADVSSEIDPVDWWGRHSADLCRWSAAARQIILAQPSSAASERVFSILNQSFGDQQQLALEDYIEASVLLQYNHH